MRSLKSLLMGTPLYRPARALRRLLRGAEGWRREGETVAFYRALVPAGALAFDIGANVGEVAEALRRAGARVVAVEPQPECLAELRARCGGRGLVAIPGVVGRAEGTATLYLRPHHAASSLRRDWLGETVGTLEVPMHTLAGLIDRFGVPAYCKVDVEGAEEDVFSTLPHPLPLVSFEYHRSGLDRAAACLERLTRGADAEVNLTHTGPLRFSLAEWVPAAEFRRTLESRLGGPDAPSYGDIWVRTRDAG
ncbi:MAG TPA: FkbM family methyltransferase [Longimicrobium sp.]|nr:FkbM family methyltransferase [Longimicrobium sp.]